MLDKKLREGVSAGTLLGWIPKLRFPNRSKNQGANTIQIGRTEAREREERVSGSFELGFWQSPHSALPRRATQRRRETRARGLQADRSTESSRVHED